MCRVGIQLTRHNNWYAEVHPREKKHAFYLLIFNKRGIFHDTLRALSPALLRLATAGEGEFPPMAGAQCPRRLFDTMEVSSPGLGFLKNAYMFV